MRKILIFFINIVFINYFNKFSILKREINFFFNIIVFIQCREMKNLLLDIKLEK